MINTRVIRIAVVSPGDVAEERECVDRVAAEINRSVGDDRHARFDVWRWETNAYPGFNDGGPQAHLDPQLRIAECDVVVGIFWRHFGTVTPDGKTGTEHEIELAYKSWKQCRRPHIMLYFSQKPAWPETDEELDQWKKVAQFKRRYSGEMLCWQYDGVEKFRECVRQHLLQYMTNIDRHVCVEQPARSDDSGFLKEFRERLGGLYRVSDLSNVGVSQVDGTRRAISVNLEDIYLPLRLAKGYKPTEVARGVVVAAEELPKRTQPMMVRGPAGAGKSTWMRWSFRRLLANEDALPLFIELRRLALAWSRTDGGAAARSLVQYLRVWLEEHKCPTDGLEAALNAKSGPVPVLLVDGWDEAGPLGSELRESLLEFIAQFPRVRVVVSSRPYGSSVPSHAEGFEEFDIQPLSDSEIQLFADKFYELCVGEDEVTAAEYSRRFQTALDRSAEAKALARTMLLLTMLLIVSRTAPLPEKRHLLYYECIRNLLTAIPERREDEPPVPECDAEMRMKIVAALAYAVQEKGFAKAGRQLIVLPWDETVHLVPGNWVDAEKSEFIRWLVERAGLLDSRADNTVSFSHLSFQEFLAALKLFKTVDGSDRASVCEKKLDDPKWWETLRLWGALVESWQEPEKWAPVMERLMNKSGGINLAGAMFADGRGDHHLFERWTDQFLEEVSNRWVPRWDDSARSWAGSRNQRRRTHLETQLAAKSKAADWLQWLRLHQWGEDAGFRVPAPHAHLPASVVLDSLTSASLSRRHVAFGRIWCGAVPTWPGIDQWKLALLQVWPSQRRLAGLQLQALATLDGGADYLYPVAAKLSFQPVDNDEKTLAFGKEMAKDVARILRNVERARAFAQYWNRDSARGMARYLAPNLAPYWRGTLDAYWAREWAGSLARGWVRTTAMRWAREVGLKLDQSVAESPVIVDFAMIELNSPGRVAARLELAFHDSTAIPEVALLIEACRVSLGMSAGERLEEALRRSGGIDPLWTALAKHVARRSTAEDTAVLEQRARHPEKFYEDGILRWGLKYIVRGDVMRPDGEDLMLDTLAEERNLPVLPYLEPVAPELIFDIGDAE